MGKKVWGIVAFVLIICGLGFAFLGLIISGFDFGKLVGDGKSVTNEHEISETVTAIEIDTSTADISFAKAADGKVKVVCTESEKRQHEVTVQNGTLMIKEKSTKKWFEYIGVFSGFGSKKKIVIYLPEKKAEGAARKLSKETAYEVDSMKIDTSTGDLDLADINVKGELSISVSTGEVKLTNVTADKLTVDSSTGNVVMADTEIRGAMKVDTSTGDVKITASDAKDIMIETSTGDVNCEFLSEKSVKTDTSTGSVKVPNNSENADPCVVDTSTGDITVTFKK